MKTSKKKVYEVTIYKPSAEFWDAQRITRTNGITGQSSVMGILENARRQLPRRIGGEPHKPETFYYVVCDVQECTIALYVVRGGRPRAVNWHDKPKKNGLRGYFDY